MTEEYIMMHKDTQFGLLAIDLDSGSITHAEIFDARFSPCPGEADERAVKRWWRNRTVPVSRKRMTDHIRMLGYESNGEYLARNLALSISDTYWICPVDLELSWKDINLLTFEDSNDGVVPVHRTGSYDPNASLGGELDKYWDVTQRPPVLHKTSYFSFGQQSVNECFAAMMHRRLDSGIAFTDYWMEENAGGGKNCCCSAFTSEKTEFISARELIGTKNATYENYIRICGEHGLDTEAVRQHMDYQILTDYVITNVDRHPGNFGILRDVDDLHFICPAPIFDSGNSMFYYEEDGIRLHDNDLSSIMINSFCPSESEMLAQVTYTGTVDMDLLPYPDEVVDFYRSSGIPEERAERIASNYTKKIEMLTKFLDR